LFTSVFSAFNSLSPPNWVYFIIFLLISCKVYLCHYGRHCFLATDPFFPCPLATIEAKIVTQVPRFSWSWICICSRGMTRKIFYSSLKQRNTQEHCFSLTSRRKKSRNNAHMLSEKTQPRSGRPHAYIHSTAESLPI
jgi:hypothetical protein